MSPRSKLLTIVLVLLYAGVMAASTGVMVALRDSTLTTFSTPEAQEAWQEWREAVRDKKVDPPTVSRRVSKSAEPPTLVMLRDHFAVSLIGVLTLATVLYWSTAMMAIGAFQGSRK